MCLSAECEMEREMRIPRMFFSMRTGTAPARYWAMVIALTAATGSAAAASWQVAGPGNALPSEIIALEIRASGDTAMVAGRSPSTSTRRCSPSRRMGRADQPWSASKAATAGLSEREPS